MRSMTARPDVRDKKKPGKPGNVNVRVIYVVIQAAPVKKTIPDKHLIFSRFFLKNSDFSFTRLDEALPLNISNRIHFPLPLASAISIYLGSFAFGICVLSWR